MLAAVGELGIDLIGDDDHVAVAQHGGDGLHLLGRHDGAGGVVGVGEHQQLGLGGDGGLQRFGGELKGILFLGLDGHGHAALGNGQGGITDESGLGQQHFVAVVQQGAHAQIDGFAAAHGDEDLVIRVVGQLEAVFQVGGDAAPQLDQAVVGGVGGFAVQQAFDAGVADMLRGDEVGLTHAQGHHVFHRGGHVEEFADARGL